MIDQPTIQVDAAVAHQLRRERDEALALIYAVVDGEGEDHYTAMRAMRAYVRKQRCAAIIEGKS